MQSKLAAIAVLAVLALPLGTVTAQDLAPMLLPNGGAAGGPALVLNNGDVLGVRNVQGGTLDDPAHGSLNLDVGAGSTAHPGDISLDYDVGRRVLIYDGHKHLVASFGPDGITFYRKPTIRTRRTPCRTSMESSWGCR